MDPVDPSSASPTLIRKTYDRLRADVLSGRLPPGHKLLMNELRSQYAVGASPLREALNRLASEAWVVHNEQRGFSVARVSVEGLEDLVATRISLESLALTQSLARRTSAWEEQLVLAFHRLGRTPRSASVTGFQENVEWEQLHRAFHFALLGACGSPLLLGFCEQLYDQAYRYRQLAAKEAYPGRNELDEHRALYDAALHGRVDEAVGLLTAHYRLTAGILDPHKLRAGAAR